MLPLLLAVSLAAAAPVRHALVIGANDGGGVLEPLRYAERDAEKFAEVLVELGDFDDELVTVLYAPTADQVRTALAKHATIAEQYDEDLFLFYYSGHADGQGIRLANERYYFEALKHDLRAIDADVRIGVLDACRSGAITRSKGAMVSESILGLGPLDARGEAWLTASSADEAAQESDRLRGGFFTHFLVSGMRGAADRGDGIVDLEELYRFTLERVVATTGETSAGPQHPHFQYGLEGYGQVYLTDLRNATARVTLPSDVSGQIQVLKLPDRVQVAELVKLPGAPLQLAVPPGRYLVRRRSEGELYAVTLGVNEGAAITVTSWGAARLEDAATRGEQRIGEYVNASLAYERKLNLGQSPLVAGAASLAIPGAGQLYNRRPWRGLFYFGASASLLAGVIYGQEHDVHPAFSVALGSVIWGASVADAIYNVHRRESLRPILGGQVSWSAAFGGGAWPYHSGFSADLMLRKGVSIGFDRVGYTRFEDGWDLSAGSRLMLAREWRRFRPGAFVGVGLRHGKVPAREVELTRLVFSAGGNLRYYVVPRYFAEAEVRWESSGESEGLVPSVGMGVHIGR